MIKTQAIPSRRYLVRLRVSSLAAITTAALVLLSGCALTEEHITLGYNPVSGATDRVPGAEQVKVAVAVQDQRTAQNHVGHKTNGYGMEMAQIIADNDISSMIKGAIETELTNRGFQIGAGEAQVNVTLQKFENRFELGWFSGTARASLIMGVVVSRANGTASFTKYVEGEGVNDGIQLANGSNAKLALDAALQDAVKKLFQDPAFISSVVAAGKMSATLPAKS